MKERRKMSLPDREEDLRWKTTLGNGDPAKKLVAGYALSELTGNVSYLDTVNLVLRGELPTPEHSALLNACMTSIIDHGFRNTIVVGARFLASANPDPIVATCAGLLGIGRYTAGAQSGVVRLLDGADLVSDFSSRARELVKGKLEAGERVLGFGTKLHREVGVDSRSRRLHEIIEASPYAQHPSHLLFHALHREMEEQLSRQIVINIDGEMGAAFSALGYSQMETELLEIVVMLPSVMGHVAEEIRTGSPMRNLPVPLTSYVGANYRPPSQREEVS
jgi:citrate synthase